MKKIFKDFLELFWLWGPALAFFMIAFSYMYYKSHYCKEIPITRIGKRCISYHTETNGFSHGKYYREWTICDGYEYYEYSSTEDSCGCNKLNK